jgi:hypothetical protein
VLSSMLAYSIRDYMLKLRKGMNARLPQIATTSPCCDSLCRCGRSQGITQLCDECQMLSWHTAGTRTV